ncbi:MAG TPA: hypothetical protein DFR83_23795 [Deltaproteobacteria bacterium]|nr:hypothetical protein [Deltaproteobacteria bacterium]
MRDPYSVLGVPKSADTDTIRKRYKELARKFHPDLNKSAGAADRFKQINEAHEVIGDPEKRKLWDEFGEMSTKPGFDAGKARAWQGAGGFRGRGGFPGGFPVASEAAGLAWGWMTFLARCSALEGVGGDRPASKGVARRKDRMWRSPSRCPSSTWSRVRSKPSRIPVWGKATERPRRA